MKCLWNFWRTKKQDDAYIDILKKNVAKLRAKNVDFQKRERDKMKFSKTDIAAISYELEEIEDSIKRIRKELSYLTKEGDENESIFDQI